MSGAKLSRRSKSLEDVAIKVSVGIGHSIIEAETGLAIAKQHKGECYYNIERYIGPKLEDTLLEASSAVESYLRLEERLAQSGNGDALADLMRLKYDPKTCLLNRMGYEVEVCRRKQENRYSRRVIILIDGDDMKNANTNLGYEMTDLYLAAMGGALRKEVRQESEKEKRESDILLNRKNDSGGDEFIVDVACDYSDAEHIAKRYIDSIYCAEKTLSRSLKNKK